MQRQIPSEASCWNITNRPPDLHSPSIQNILLWILLKKQPDIRYPTLDIFQRDVAPSANPPQRDIAFACAFPPPWIDTKLQAARSVCTFLPSRFVLWPFPDKAPSCAPALFAPLLYIVSFRSPEFSNAARMRCSLSFTALSGSPTRYMPRPPPAMLTSTVTATASIPATAPANVRTNMAKKALRRRSSSSG